MKRIGYILVIVGVVLGLALVALRVQSAFTPIASGGGPLSELLGYGDPKVYAVMLTDNGKPPLLVIGEISDGALRILSASRYESSFENASSSLELATVAADVSLHQSSTTPSSLYAFVYLTRGGVDQVLDVFSGIEYNGDPLTPQNVDGLLTALTEPTTQLEEVSSQIDIHTTDLVVQSVKLLAVARSVLAHNEAGLLFMVTSPIGKNCIGACGNSISQYLVTDGQQ